MKVTLNIRLENPREKAAELEAIAGKLEKTNPGIAQALRDIANEIGSAIARREPSS